MREEPVVAVVGDIPGRGEVPSTGGGGIALERGGAETIPLLGINGVAIGGGAIVVDGKGGTDPATAADEPGNGDTGLTPVPNGDAPVGCPPDGVGIAGVVVVAAF